MKKFLNYVGLSVDSEGGFLYAMRRAKTRSELFSICHEYMTKPEIVDENFSLVPFDGLTRPKVKTCLGGSS